MSEPLRYEQSHPWISFEFALQQNVLWCLLGEAASRCSHLIGTPLQPPLATELAAVYLVRGAVATTAIEGNTLTEGEARDLLEARKTLPTSQRYLQTEIENVVRGLRHIDESARSGEPFRVSAEWIRRQNAIVLDGLEVDEHVVPGHYTQVKVVAGNYRGAPPEDIEYLVERLARWLGELLAPLDDPATTTDMRFFCSFLAATLGHLYIAWIHPFGDGNGRTARLLECAILAHSGAVPWVSSNLLSDHYNRTRGLYYRRLDLASRDRDVLGFLTYSAQGYVEQIREQIATVQAEQRTVAWINYVHEIMASVPDGPTQKRQRMLVLALPLDAEVDVARARRLTVELAELYATRTDKTLTRDLNRLRELGLIERRGSRIRSRIDVLDAFTPRARDIPPVIGEPHRSG